MSAVADPDGARRTRRLAKLARLPKGATLMCANGQFERSWLDLAGGVAPPGWRVAESPAEFAQADVVLLHLPELQGLADLPKAAHQLWVGVTAECDEYYPQQRDPAVLERLDLVASYHADSDLPINYTFPAVPGDLQGPVPAKSDSALVCATISNSHSRSAREAAILALEAELPVHHYGRWRRSHDLGEDTGRAAKLDLLARYRFHLAYENCFDEDYVTEKWFDCLVAGCVPVYRGAPNIARFAPSPDCYIDALAFPDAGALAAHLRALAADPAAYAAMFAWRTRPLPTAFLALFEGNREPLLHRVARRLDEERARLLSR